MPTTKIMVIRHAERPDVYEGGQYDGVSPTGDVCGDDAKKHLTTLGWQRAGALITLFAPPWGPRHPALATPDFLFASNPTGALDAATDDVPGGGPSQRPAETLIPLSKRLGLTTNAHYDKNHYSEMVSDALACDGVVLIAWQHEDIPLQNKAGAPGLSQCILQQTNTTDNRLRIPSSWPKGPQGARYDLIWVFDRPTGLGSIASFTLVPQVLLAGDQAEV